MGVLMSQARVVEALLSPQAYDESVSEVELLQTHISFLFLAGDFVYKMKKAVDFGFLDFTTLEKRRFYCHREVELNRRLCGKMYLGVVPVNESTRIKILGEGKPVEYAVKMQRMPQERMMSRLLEEDQVDKTTLDQIAKIVAEFHSRAETSAEIAGYGSLDIISRNWEENFEQTEKYVGETLSADNYRVLQSGVQTCMKTQGSLFERRRTDGRIRDCHGDIHSGNIFVTDRIYIFDAIEFNNRFRYSDVASDVAFLAMDLDFKGHNDLSKFFVERYIQYSRDQELPLVLPFYKCYRAYVRGKVASFQLDEPSLESSSKLLQLEKAQKYFILAAKYEGML
jgi:aminoglycoside phosphotransferase family enzyme